MFRAILFIFGIIITAGAVFSGYSDYFIILIQVLFLVFSAYSFKQYYFEGVIPKAFRQFEIVGGKKYAVFKGWTIVFAICLLIIINLVSVLMLRW